MDIEELYNRLEEFADYLDNMKPSKEKGKLSSFFVGYNESLRQLRFLMHKTRGHLD